MGNGHLSTVKGHPSDFDRRKRRIYKKKKRIGPLLERNRGHVSLLEREVIRGEKGHVSYLNRGTDQI